MGAHQALPVPAERETMLHVVVPADRMAVLSLWERALRSGVAVGAVHVLSDPDQLVSLSIIDARHRYGVWLATLTDDAEAGESTPELLAGPLVIPTRPRLATGHKSMFAIITATDANVSKMLAWTAEQMIGERSTAFIHPDEHDRAVSSWMELVAALTGCLNRAPVTRALEQFLAQPGESATAVIFVGDGQPVLHDDPDDTATTASDPGARLRRS